ncbi:MAG: seryl-tRNA synthetase [Halieaceae bacterium]|jgi:seryl-tRNA synthetase
MLDLKLLRQNPQELATKLEKKGFELDVPAFQALDAKRKQADIDSQNLLAERKNASKKIGELVKAGASVEEAKITVNETLARIAEQLDEATATAKAIQTELDDVMLGIPNIPDPEVPEGRDEEANVELSRWGDPRNFEFTARDHVDIGQDLGLLDFDRASLLTGSRFSIMHAGLARLHRALIQFMLNTHTGEHGYTEIYVPYIVNSASLFGTGQLPKFADDLFKLHHDPDYYLIPTAEVPVTNLVRDQIIESEALDAGYKFACHTPCFRSEAGSYGRDTRGMIRQHQFEKVELVQMVRPDRSSESLEELTGHAESILRALELPYRKVILCGGDLSFAARRTYDLEVWLPGQSAYREISSCSNFGDFQARRMMARWRNPETGKPEYLHTLNGSGLAVGRTLVAIMENYQTADGGVTIPAVLSPYMGGLDRLEA